MGTILEVKDLQKTYGKNPALKGVTLSVQAGTCFGLLGPNGAGKSTTMKILTGIVDADGGETQMFGFNISKHQAAIRRQAGYVPQAITLYEKLTARDNLVFFGEMYGVSGKALNRRIEEVLKQTGLLSRAKETVEKFSGGMKRRINIALALLHKPKLLILMNMMRSFLGEKEAGMLFRLRSTPMRPMTYLVGMWIPSIVICLAICGTGIGLAVSFLVRGENQGRGITMLITLGGAALQEIWKLILVLIAFGVAGLLVALWRFKHFMQTATS